MTNGSPESHCSLIKQEQDVIGFLDSLCLHNTEESLELEATVLSLLLDWTSYPSLCDSPGAFVALGQRAKAGQLLYSWTEDLLTHMGKLAEGGLCWKK